MMRMIDVDTTLDEQISPRLPSPPSCSPRVLWSRSLLQSLQFYQCPLERDDPAGGEPGHRKLAVAVAPRIRVHVR